MANRLTKHIVLDLETNRAYALKLDANGACKAAEALQMSLDDMRDRPLFTFGSDEDRPETALPYGRTSYAIELDPAGRQKAGRVFTIRWPGYADAQKGALPEVLQKPLPGDFVKAGLAAPVNNADAGRAARGLVDEQVLEEAFADVNRMIGQGAAKKMIAQVIAHQRFNEKRRKRNKERRIGKDIKRASLHMAFVGPTGTGKTTLARALAKGFYALGLIDRPEVVEVTRKDLVAPYIGQSEDKTNKVVQQARGGILFIDEFYALFEKGGADTQDFGKKVIDQLVADIENYRDDLIVIVAGYEEEMEAAIRSNPGFKNRFTRFVNFSSFTESELGLILDQKLAEHGADFGGFRMTPDARAAAMRMLDDDRKASGRHFGNGRAVRNLVEALEHTMSARLDRAGVLKDANGLSGEEEDRLMSTITLEDVRAVDIGVLGGKEPARERKPVGFDLGAFRKAAGKSALPETPPENDNGAAPPDSRVTPVPVRRIGFKLDNG